MYAVVTVFTNLQGGGGGGGGGAMWTMWTTFYINPSMDK